MRLVSNKESVARGVVSILAIAETLLAIALVFYLSTHFNTLRWLAFAMCVSPLLLLRTDKSAQLCKKIFDERFNQLEEKIEYLVTCDGFFPALAAMAAIYVGLPILALYSRLISTAICALRAPAESFQAIPKNWALITLAMDSFRMPEIVPGHSTFSAEMLVDAPTFGERALEAYLFYPLLIPPLLYRYSLKATSIIYAPLVFVAHSTFSESTDLRTKLELIKRCDLSRIRVWYGVIAIAAFLVKLVLMLHLPGFAEKWDGHPISQFLALYVAPTEIPKWQLAEVANSVLAIGGMLFARRALLGYELQHPWPEVPVKRLLGFVSGLRWVLSLYTILCTGYITMRAAQHWHWPALGEKWLPW